MKKISESNKNIASKKPYQVRLPGFHMNEEIGLGDLLKRASSSVGIKPCGGCEKRAALLNSWMVFK